MYVNLDSLKSANKIEKIHQSYKMDWK